jgi:Asp-tRNA(Asn)/Glu-tRNA(Gln) amidotransferase B subunit
MAGVFLALSGQRASADAEAEYSRMTLGGGQSESGRYRVDDAITTSAGGEEQKGARYEVKNIKNARDTTAVKNWKKY